MSSFKKFFYEADQTLYHGTKKDFDWFEPGKEENVSFDRALGTHFSHTPAIANKFALQNPSRPGNRGSKYGGRVIPAKVEGEIYDIPYVRGKFDQDLIVKDAMKVAFELQPDLEKKFRNQFADKIQENDPEKTDRERIISIYFDPKNRGDRFGSRYGLYLIGYLELPVAKQILDVYKNHLLDKGYGLIRYVNTGKYERKGLKGEDLYSYIALKNPKSIFEDEGLEEDDNKVNGNFQKWYDTSSKKNQNNFGKPIHPKPEGVKNFWKWFGESKVVDKEGRPIVCYHGTGTEFENFNTDVIWFSTDPKLSSEYADARGAEVGSAPANIVAYIKAENPFDSSKIKKSSVRVADFFVAMDKQSNNKFSVKLKELLDIVKSAAIMEESGPYYSLHDFWFLPREMFGKTGAAAITEAFRVCGFDSIYYIENGIPTWGVFDQSQIKSAIGNNGSFSPVSKKITEKKKDI